MLTVDKNILTKEDALRFVISCEETLENSLNAVADEIAEKSDVKIVTLAGPTCSGKTTAAAKLTNSAAKHGLRARVLSIDDFYKNTLTSFENVNFESADAIDIDYFDKCVNGLLRGESVFLPTFDFKSKERSALTEYTPDENDIYIFEGIQAMYPEIRSVFSDHGYISVSISVTEDVKIGDDFFDKNDVRLTRRLLRDYRFRASSIDTTMFLWKNVRENEENNIYPYLYGAKYRINSFLPYELMYIGKELLPILADATVNDEYKQKLDELASKLKRVRCNSIMKDMIPLRSLFREFIG